MTEASTQDTTNEAFITQCEDDYTKAEITALAHIAPGTREPTHVFAVVELIHRHLELNPLIGLDPNSGGYPRRVNLGTRGGTLLIQRWHVSVRDGIQWYRACTSGSMSVPGMESSPPTNVQLGQLGDDPPWPHLVVEVEKFWPHSEFWGDRPGGSRWHRLIPLNAVDITHGWEVSDFETARDFFLSQIHVDLLSRSVLLGSCHLLLPNPVFRGFHQRTGSDWQSVTYDLELHPAQSFDGLELTFWNQRSWGATSVRRMTLQPGINVLPVPEGVEEVAHSVFCKKRGLLKQSKSTRFVGAINTTIGIVSEQRRVEAPKGGYTVDVIGASESTQVGTPRPEDALTRLAVDENQQRTQKAWRETAFQWFDNDSVAGTQAVRDIIQSASRSVDLLDPYFGSGDLMEFTLSTTRTGLPFRVLTSHDFCTSVEDPDQGVERGEALAKTLDSVRKQDPRLKIEIKVMPGKKSPVHDRFLIVDGIVWVLGASLNEFGSRGSLLMKLPASPDHSTTKYPAFSVSTSVFDAHWNTSDFMNDWVKQRATARTGPQGQSQAATFKERVLSTIRTLKVAFRRVLEIWRA